MYTVSFQNWRHYDHVVLFGKLVKQIKERIKRNLKPQEASETNYWYDS